MILAVIYTISTAVKLKPEKNSGLTNYDIYSTSAVISQLSYQGNLELVWSLVCNIPVYEKCINIM